MALPPGQQTVWNAIKKAVRRDSRVPTPAALAHTLGITLPGLRDHLDALERAGLLERRSFGRGSRPDVRLTLTGQFDAGLLVPVLGTIPAGSPLEAVEDRVGFLSLPNRPGCFALRVEGESMADLILPGDVVLLDSRIEPRSGEVCAVRVGDDATLKHLDWRGERATLRPHNLAFKPLTVPRSKLHVDGVFRSLYRGDLKDLFVPVEVHTV